MRHIPVLLQESLDVLQLSSDSRVIDCTLGDAGHAEQILEQSAPDGMLLGIDVDPEAILRASKFLHRFADRAILVRDSFVHLEQIVNEKNFGPVTGILMDLGWSTPQFEERGRGFSFLKEEEPLDMRLSGSRGDTAATLIAQSSEQELEKMFHVYGEEKFAKDIAQYIKKQESVDTVKQLNDCVLAVYRKRLNSDKEIPWVGGVHPATKVFQALRIAVNKELDVLEQALPQAVKVLAPGGRLAVISFHSLEDRIVKHFFKSEKHIKIITKKPIVCGEEEYEQNPRARSAKLRVIEKI